MTLDDLLVEGTREQAMAFALIERWHKGENLSTLIAIALIKRERPILWTDWKSPS